LATIDYIRPFELCWTVFYFFLRCGILTVIYIAFQGMSRPKSILLIRLLFFPDALEEELVEVEHVLSEIKSLIKGKLSGVSS